MAEDSGPQAAAPVSKAAKTGSVDNNGRHQTPALVPVAEAESNGLQPDSPWQGTCEHRKLPLQIPAKNDLLAEASGRGQRHPKNHFQGRLRHHGGHRLRWSGFEQTGENLYGAANNDDKGDTDAEVT